MRLGRVQPRDVGFAAEPRPLALREGDVALRVRCDRFDPTLPAFSAIGYREAWAVLDGTMTVEAAIAEDARRNVGFAKRQRTWFRSEPDVTWLDAGAQSTLDDALVVVRGLVERG